jgi:hypothetical protein
MVGRSCETKAKNSFARRLHNHYNYKKEKSKTGGRGGFFSARIFKV